MARDDGVVVVRGGNSTMVEGDDSTRVGGDATVDGGAEKQQPICFWLGI